MPGRRDFLSQPAPENYVAGLGRGATGFTTRSDLGPAREGPSEDQIKAAVAKRSAQLEITVSKDEDKEDEPRYQDPDNEAGLFAGGIYTKDDEEDDRIWASVEEKIAKRRQKQRETREQAERAEYDRKNPKIQQQFAGLKRALASVTDEDWANLPDARDMTGRAKRARQERLKRTYVVPDSVLAAGRDAGEFSTTVMDDGPSNAQDGTATDFAKIGAARDKVLQARLEQASQSSINFVTGSSTGIDPRGYLTSLGSNTPGAEESIGDIEQFRKMLKSAVDSNPRQASSWIAAARLENHAGKKGAARILIGKGCQYCLKSEDIWLENIHLNDIQNAKIIAAEAIKHNPQSVKLWVEAMKLENDPRSKKKVIRRALDNNRESEALWKEAVKLEENPDDARILLASATELIPGSLDLWLALARLETMANARKVLNAAVKRLPNSHEIWVAAARLEEQAARSQGDGAVPRPVMKNAVKFLAKQNAMPKREVWIAEAEKCEEDGDFLTCNNIVEETLGWGLDEDDDRKEIWLEDAKNCIHRGRYATARAIYAYAIRVFPTSKTVYLDAVDLEKNYGTKDDLWRALEKAVGACPKVEIFWLMLAREKSENADEARLVLARAFKQNQDNEDIWLAAVKLEADIGNYEQARDLLKTARDNAPTDRVWMRSIDFERQLGDNHAALDLTQGALRLFPAAPKLWAMKGQIYEALNMASGARAAYGTGVKAVPSFVPLWLLYARLEARNGNVVKARSILDRARQAVPKSPELWCELIRIERRAGNLGQAESLLATALQQMPKSGLLWAERILYLVPAPQRKTMATEAVKKAEDDPVTLVSTARILWGDRKLKQAYSWLQKALLLDPDHGDTWAWYYKFMLQHGKDLVQYGINETPEDVGKKCQQNDPRHGEQWQPIAKNPVNATKAPGEILKLVAASLPSALPRPTDSQG